MKLLVEFEYYKAHHDELVALYNGRVVVIKDDQLLGVYDTERQAVDATMPSHPLGTFFVQRCGPGPENYTVIFHSPRVRLN